MDTTKFTCKSFIKGTLSDVDGHWSSKRVVTGIGIMLFVIYFFANLVFDATVEAGILNVLTSIILTGLGVTVAERFGKKFDDVEKFDLPESTKETR